MDQTRKKQSKNPDNIQLKDPNQKLNPTSKEMTHKYHYYSWVPSRTATLFTTSALYSSMEALWSV